MTKKIERKNFSTKEITNLYKINNIQKILNNYDKKVAKSLGQHYLTDLNILQKIVNTISKSSTKFPTKFVIEIGAGIGILTEQLLKKNISVYSVEIEKKSIEILKEIFHNYLIHQQKEIISNSSKTFLFLEQSDFLKSKIFNQKNFNSKITFIGNLPYNVSSRIIVTIGEKLLSSCYQCCFMLQKEVSEKIRCRVGDKSYGKLSILCHYFFEVINYFPVSANCFFPKPKVVSEVIHLKPRLKKIGKEYPFFKELVHLSFQQRRKKIFKNIISHLKIDKKILENLFASAKIPLNARAENLNYEQFLELSRLLNEQKKI